MSGTLSPRDRQRLQTLFERAAGLPKGEREEWLWRECGSHVALRDELVRLLGGLDGVGILDRTPDVKATRVGAQIGRYILLEKIGEGGMGEVYLAEQREPIVRRVALKIIRHGLESAQGLARFELERQVLAELTHRNVAQVLDAGTADDGSPYFVMELVAGEPLTRHCDREKLSTRARIELFVDVCDAVQHAHQKGIIHRDLKPSNLLVMEQDGRPVPKVIDFGIARATAGPLADRTQQTMLGQVVGTLDYMSPEQADPSSEGVDTRSDIYSLGVVLYELLSGLLPFEHDSSGVVLLSDAQRAIREIVPPTPSGRLRKKTETARAVAPLRGTNERALLRQLSGDLDWVCMRALEKDPARRYQSASELAADLRRHLAHQPVLAARPSALYRAGRFVRRNRLAVLAGTLVTAGVAVGVLGIAAGRREAEAKNDELLRLADVERYSQLADREADKLWPPHPARIPDLEEWLPYARDLVARLPTHRKTLAEVAERIRAQTAPEHAQHSRHTREPGDDAAGAIDFAFSEDRWQYQMLTELVKDLEAMEASFLPENALRPDDGWSIPKRLELARELEKRFADGGDCARVWSAYLPAIHADYPELSNLSPQMGLLPLGRDSKSGLWEFAHLLSGAPAERVDGELLLTPETGVVLVLLRGGTFTRGAQSRLPNGKHYYAKAASSEGPPDEVTLEPFFLSKFELTQGQWTRMAGSNPAENIEEVVPPGHDFQLHPVNRVTQDECTRMMTRVGLILPHEDQWEYAARAGTDTAWGTGDETFSGDDPRSLVGKANLLDTSVNQPMLEFILGSAGGPQVDWDDGYQAVAPVGTLESNAFGLYNMYGNVTEWCSNSPGKYGWGNRNTPGRPRLRQARGGSFATGSESARSAYRWFQDNASTKKGYTGLRPARVVDP